MSNLKLFLPDAEATVELGHMIGALVDAGQGPQAFMLYGDMGGGKTTLMRGLVTALPGSDDAEIASPSFTIVNVYNTVPLVYHADLFRCPPGLGIPEELEEALDACADGGGKNCARVCIEWPDHLPAYVMPAKRLDILLEPCQGSRRFSAVAHGDAARDMCAALCDVVLRTRPDWLQDS